MNPECFPWLVDEKGAFNRRPRQRFKVLFDALHASRAFNSRKDAAIVIQRYLRGCITRKRLLGKV